MSRKQNTSIGPMSKRSEHVKHYMPPRVDFSDLPQRITNAGSKTPYSQKAAWSTYIRPERLVAFSLPSRDGFSVPSTQGEVRATTSQSEEAELGAV